jgi:hypothetical protein
MPKTPRLHFIENFSEGDTDRQLQAMQEVFEFTGPEEADILFLASIFKLQEAMSLKAQFNKPIVVYCWDYYLWKHNSDALWMTYAAFLRNHASLVLVPSTGQQLRLKELLDVDSTVVRTGIPTYEAEVTDGDFILDPVRYYPEENQFWAEEAAKELGIPIIHSEHQYSLEEFRKLVTSCTFLTCAYREASTGGLSLMEGLYLGKPSLVSDSPYMGAKDYLLDNGYYFKHDDFGDLKKQMQFLWDTRPKAKGPIPTYQEMARGICEASKKLLGY